MLSHLCLALPTIAMGPQQDLLEDFALAEDRSAALRSIVPGTEEGYFFQCLERQHAGDLAAVDALLDVWAEKGGGPLMEEVLNRQALLTSETRPGEAFAFLIERLGLVFDQEPDVPGAGRQLPSHIPATAISLDSLTVEALSRPHLRGLEDSMMRRLDGSALEGRQLVDWLRRLRRPDVPGLAEQVVRDLSSRKGAEFGSVPIHSHLLLAQLDTVADLLPVTRNSPAFVQAYMQRLQPAEHGYVWGNRGLRGEYLRALRGFTDGLLPIHNDLKASVLGHLLAHQLETNSLDPATFLAWVSLPRSEDWSNPTLSTRHPGAEQVGENTPDIPLLGPGPEGSTLLLRCLQSIFTSSDGYELYRPYIRERYLARLFAETKLLTGQDGVDGWVSLLDDPAYYELLQERVELTFPLAHDREFLPGEPVQVTVDMKNVETLLVKVFEVDTFGWYSVERREVDANIALEGLVPGEEFSFVYGEPSMQRFRRTFDFPQLENPGLYVIEFIGGGLSSRAIIRKGSLQLRERRGAAGHLLYVVSPDGAVQGEASAWIDGREYKSRGDGSILVPYTTEPRERQVIITSGGVSSLQVFDHAAETYELMAGIHVDREALLAGRQAQALVRPRLSLAGEAVSITVLEGPSLEIVAISQDGSDTTLVVEDVELSEARELVQDFLVPLGTAAFRLRLRGSVSAMDGRGLLPLVSPWSEFHLNGIDSSQATACPLLLRGSDGWFIELRGKNGESRPGVPLALEVKLEGLRDSVRVKVVTDTDGRVSLGTLQDVSWLRSSGFGGRRGSWTIQDTPRALPATIHGQAGQALRIPVDLGGKALSRDAVSLIELAGGQFAHDRFDLLRQSRGSLELFGLSPGTYDLEVMATGQRALVEIADAPLADGWLIGESRWLEKPKGNELLVTDLAFDDDGLSLTVHGASQEARVHVLTGRYFQAYDPRIGLALPAGSSPGSQPAPGAMSEFHSNRVISDEYRYVLERRYQEVFPGNMLERPGLLLNPWAGDAWGSVVGLGGGAAGRFGGRHGGKRSLGAGAKAERVREPDHVDAGSFASLDFLPAASTLIANQVPGPDGMVVISKELLAGASRLQVVVVDRGELVVRQLSLEAPTLVPLDRRMLGPLDPAQHLHLERRIDYLPAGATAELATGAEQDFEVFDSLRDVFDLFRQEPAGQGLGDFTFLLEWPALNQDQQLSAYSQFACHEVDLFLYHKDRGFFDATVRPYLANKAHKGFLDHWLLGHDLDRYLEPWSFGKLNVLERILLSQRAGGGRLEILRGVQELAALNKPDPRQAARVFDKALSSGLLGRERGVRYRGPGDSPPAGGGGGGAAGPSAPGPVGPGAIPAPPNEDLAALGYVGEDDGPEVMDAESSDGGERDSLMQSGEGVRLGKEAAERGRAGTWYADVPDAERLTETHYYRRAIGSVFLDVNPFWSDLAGAEPGDDFISTNFSVATGSLNEMLLALAVLDLPLEGGVHAYDPGSEPGGYSFTAGGPLVLVRRVLSAAGDLGDGGRFLLAQDLFHEGEGGQPITGADLLAGVPYLCRVAVTNPTHREREVEVLLQIPAGSIPVGEAKMTRGLPVAVPAYGTVSMEYSFYFPEPGEFTHYPAHASEAGKLLAYAQGGTIRVLGQAPATDKGSWAYLSQEASLDELLAYLEGANLSSLDLGALRWRVRGVEGYRKITSLLRRRHSYQHALWGASLLHRDPLGAGEYLRHCEAFIEACGPALDSPLVQIEPVTRGAYEHAEFTPLVNERAHPFAGQRVLNNPAVAHQYQQLLEVLARKPALDDLDWLQVAYYMLLQERVRDALDAFDRIDPGQLETQLQYDYLRAYLDFYTTDQLVARGIAASYVDHPVERWRARFREVMDQLDEAQGLRGSGVDIGPEGQDASAGEVSLEISVQGERLTITHAGLGSCEVRYYGMDVEFLFSKSPFVQGGAGGLGYVMPSRTEQVSLPPGGAEVTVDLPDEFALENVWIEVRGGGVVRRQARYANSLTVQVMETIGQVRVTHSSHGGAVPAAYIKVYVRDQDGVRFHKDGYTDLRGRFDYASVSGRTMAGVERLSILVLSRAEGAVIREVSPPPR